MTEKTRKPPRPDAESKDGTKSGTDTASYEQLHGATDAHGAPGKLRYPQQPHERDESASPSADRLKQERPPSDHQISQAAEDVESGRVDTDRRGVPSDVPKSKPT